MGRRPTILEHRYGKPPGIEAVLQIWQKDLVDNLLNIVWQAYDSLYEESLSKIQWSSQFDDLERSITRWLELAIRQTMNPYLPYTVQHGPPEHESRSGGKAQPPEYDIAFVFNADPRIMWPLEAKVIKTDKNTEDNFGDYIQTLNKRFLACYYAPFSPSGAMIGYLVSGDPKIVLQHIEKRIGVQLKDYPNFIIYDHKISDHHRDVPKDKDYPVEFRCHHMIFPLFK